MKNKLIIISCLFSALSLQIVCAQTVESPAKFCKESLMGKKWIRKTTFIPGSLEEARDGKVLEVETKKITIKEGQVMEISQVFDNDSVICITKIGAEIVSELHYGYYLSDSFAFVFDDTRVGKNDCGNWLNMHTVIMANGKNRNDGTSLKIESLSDEKLVISFPGSRSIIEWTAEPLD